jgi:hypothetical protein
MALSERIMTRSKPAKTLAIVEVTRRARGQAKGDIDGLP